MNYSRTQRILLLIDLNPLLHLQNPNSSYLDSILTASKILLSFPSLSSSLFAFKFFFSSLSPLRSSSALHSLSNTLSFNLPSQTLHSLSKTLNSLSTSSFPTLKEAVLPSQASNTVKSLLQLLHDYAWDLEIDNVSGTAHDFPLISSNLVVLLSPICKSVKCLGEFLNLDVNDESLRNSDMLSVIFRKHFGVVNDKFVIRDIHLSWVDVNYENESSDEKEEMNEFLPQLRLVENGIRSLGWGFCSTDSIILGSALVPFGLIYPHIGAYFMINNNELNKKIRGQLSLKVSDVSGKPLECKCCDLELLRVRTVDMVDGLDFRNSLDAGIDTEQKFCDQFGEGIATLHVEAVQKYMDSQTIITQSHNQFLVQLTSEESLKSKNKYSDEFFADRVLQQISGRSGESIHRSSCPIWPIFLSSLYKEGCWALVSILRENGDSFKGILKPFTVHLALLSIIGDVINKEPSKLIVVDNSERYNDLKVRAPTSETCLPLVDGKRKRIKRHLLPDLTWTTFHTAAFKFSCLDLAEVYFARDLAKSKKLKFIKCWLRQIQKSSSDHQILPDKSKLHQNDTKETNERLSMVHHEPQLPIFSQFSSEPQVMQEGAASVSYSETAEAFFYNLPSKIQHGLEAEGVDLQILAQRLVNSTIHWLHQKQEDSTLENQTSELKSTFDRALTAKLIELLTRDPKEMKRRNDNHTSLQASDQAYTSEIIVREYELQILLRMEILQAEVAGTIERLLKRKLIKQVCSLLEVIQYLVEGGIHGHMTLYDYAERTIRTRYQHKLGDVVEKIYTQMDLLPFGEEDDSHLLLLNSEDSNQFWRDKQESYNIADNKDSSKLISTEGESSQQLEINDENTQDIRREEHAQKLSEAQKRRERARRFVSFTSWVPDLERVWAPKQPKSGQVKSQSLSSKSKRKERHTSTYTVVCETPMTGKKHSGSQRTDKESQDQGSNSSSCVPKALFQDGH